MLCKFNPCDSTIILLPVVAVQHLYSITFCEISPHQILMLTTEETHQVMV